MKGILESLNEVAGIVKVAGNDYALAERCKTGNYRFIKPLVGKMVSCTVDKQNSSLITFIKSDEALATKTQGPSATSFTRSAETQERISSQWAINAAIELIKLNRAQFEGTVSINHVFDIAKQLKEGSVKL